MHNCQKIKNRLTAIDIYGIPIEMTVGGERKFQTICGAVATIITILVVLVLSISGLLLMNEIETVFETMKYQDLKENDQSFNPFKSNFNIAFGFRDRHFEKYGRFEFNYVQWGWKEDLDTELGISLKQKVKTPGRTFICEDE